MDVVCDRCRAEYEFDDALVSERGTTVKCTSCGHQFKIYRPSSHPEAARPWNLRRPDGTVIPFDSLAVLQKWILEGRVARTDEISRAGDAWKPLGAIAELESFFSTAELRSGQPTTTKNSNRPPPPPLRAPTPRPPPPHAAPHAPHAPHAPPLPPLPTPSHRPGAGTSGHPTRPDGTDASRTVGAPAIPAPPRVPHLDVPRAATATADGYALGAPALPPPPDVAIGPPTPPRAAPSLSPPPLPSDPPPRAQPEPTADDDEPLPPVAKRSSGLVVGVALGLLVTVGGVGFAWHMGYLGARPTSSPTAGPSVATPPPDLTPRLADARRLASRVTRASLEEAHEELTRALAVAPDDAAVLAARAAVMASWSEMLRVRADELEARAQVVSAEAPQLRAEAALVRRDGVERLARARTDAERAEALAQRAPPRGEARAALEADLADVARIAGDVPGARRHLDAAREAGGGASVDLVASLVARDTGLAPQAVEGLRAVVAREANAVRARLALARLLGAQGDITGARAELDAVTRDVPDHEDAVRLSRAALAGEPPMRGTQVAAVAPAPATAADAAAPQAADASQRAPASGDEPVAGRSYDQLVREGDRLQDEGHTGQARERYRAALAMRANGCEALAGLGFVALEERELSSAVSYFRRSLSSDPGYSEALVGLGEAYSSQQQYQQALDAYQRYLRQEPGGEHAHMARRQIESLQERVRAPQGSEQAPSPGN